MQLCRGSLVIIYRSSPQNSLSNELNHYIRCTLKNLVHILKIAEDHNLKKYFAFQFFHILFIRLKLEDCAGKAEEQDPVCFQSTQTLWTRRQVQVSFTCWWHKKRNKVGEILKPWLSICQIKWRCVGIWPRTLTRVELEQGDQTTCQSPLLPHGVFVQGQGRGQSNS